MYMCPILCFHSYLACLPVLAIVPRGAKIIWLPISVKIFIVITWVLGPQPSSDIRHKPAQAPGMGEQPKSGRSEGIK